MAIRAVAGGAWRVARYAQRATRPGLLVVGLLAGVYALAAPARQAAPGWQLVVLGIAQDAGIPQLNCTQPLCQSIRDGKRKPEKVASIGLRLGGTSTSYLFDATPDFVAQVHALTGGPPPSGIFLTHGHIGHYTGLMYLGRESIDAKGVPVFATPRMVKFLTDNGPWSLLVSRKNIDLRTLVPAGPEGPAYAFAPIALGGGLRITPIPVPHRDEFTDTVGYLIEGPRKKALYIPDIDGWDKWSRSIRELADTVDYLFLDGTFAAANEIPGRTEADIPHPLMKRTRDLLRATRNAPPALWFIHLNHTNAELGAADVVREGMRFVM